MFGNGKKLFQCIRHIDVHKEFALLMDDFVRRLAPWNII